MESLGAEYVLSDATSYVLSMQNTSSRKNQSLITNAGKLRKVESGRDRQFTSYERSLCSSERLWQHQLLHSLCSSKWCSRSSKEGWFDTGSCLTRDCALESRYSTDCPYAACVKSKLLDGQVNLKRFFCPVGPPRLHSHQLYALHYEIRQRM